MHILYRASRVVPAVGVMLACMAVPDGAAFASIPDGPAPPVSQQADRRITGIVKDADGQVLPGVSVLLKGTKQGTSTDGNGRFSLNVPDDESILVFSYVGYLSMETIVGKRTQLSITLASDTRMLTEVVVVGYGEQNRKDVTGSITTVKEQDIRNLTVTGVDQALQGKAAGVTVTTNTGQPGGGVSVRVRGITSLTGSNEPLYVVDGVPFSGDGEQSQAYSTFGGGGGQTSQSILASINPNDIVSIDILKDASATAIYGSRASNGVIIITTKRGKEGQTRVSYDTYLGFQEVPKVMPVMNLREYAAYNNVVRTVNGFRPQEEFANLDVLGEGTNWQQEVFRRASIMNHQLSLSGGTDKTKFYISGNYFDQQGIVIGSDFNRYSLRFNLDNQTREWLKIGMSATVNRTNQRLTLNDDSNGVVNSAFLQAPNIPVQYPDGAWGGPIDQVSAFQTNPVAMALQRDVTRAQNRLLGNLYTDIRFMQGLHLRTEFGGDYTIGDNAAFNPTYAWGLNVNTQNKFVRRTNQSTFWVLKNYLTYNKTIATKHRFTLMTGHEAMKSAYEWVGGSRTGFFSNDVLALNAGTALTAANENGRGAQTLESVFGRFNYGFSNRFNLTFTYRADGSSKFGPANRWGYFPSAAAAWTISNEPFMKGIPTISQLKLRVGYGAVGNQNIRNYAYGSALNSVITNFGTGFYPDKIPNANVKWESAIQTNLGVDLGLFNSRINLTVDLYDKLSKDFLYQLPVPMYTGAGSNYDDLQAPYVNLGRMRNRGIDLSLNTETVRSGAFSWKTNAIVSMYRNKLESLSDNSAAIYKNVQWFNSITATLVGQPVGLFYGYVVDGIFQSQDELNSAPTQAEKIAQSNGTWLGDLRFRNLDQTPVNGKQIIDGKDRTLIGNPNPDFTFGFTNTFSYKGFDLSLFLQGSYGNDIYNFTRSYTEGMNDIGSNQLRSVVNRWTPDNTNTTIPRAILGDPNGNRRMSDRFVEDGSYMRVQNLTLGYTLPQPLAQKLKLNRLRVYATAQNLYTFTNYSGLDPELGSYNQDALLMNIDNGHYPAPRVMTAGINIEL
jgi:TonB-dependent starch-binding outer membrane protein SusC